MMAICMHVNIGETIMKKLIEVVQEAGRNGVAIGHFNIADLVLLKGVFQAARELNVPVMVGGYLFNGCPELATHLGADGSADNAEPAIAIANALVAQSG